MPDLQTGIIFEGRMNNVIIVAVPQNTWVGIIAGKKRIAVTALWGGGLLGITPKA
jgi:hypothetical protein